MLRVAPVSAALTVEIIEPSIDPYTTLPGCEIEFIAAVYLDGEEWDDPNVTFQWDFGDLDSATGNPVTHAYDEAGQYPCTVTVTYSGQQAQDTVTAVIEGDTSTPGYSLELEPPSGTICDTWGVKLTAPGPSQLPTVSITQVWHAENGGPFTQSGHVGFPSYPQIENGKRVWHGSWMTWPCPNLSSQVKVKLHWWGFGMVNPPQGDAWTNALSATPKNTVVKAWESLHDSNLILYDPLCTAPLVSHPFVEWSAIHRQWAGTQPNQHFHWALNILDLSGGTIKTRNGTQASPGEGGETWDGSRNAGGLADLGVYSFQAVHTHMMSQTGHPNCSILGECGPQSDKPGSIAIEDVSAEDVSFDVPLQAVSMYLSYRLTGAASVCRATLYAVNLKERADNPAANPFHNLGTQELERWAGPHIQFLVWYTDPRPYYYYWVVVEAKETQGAAVVNRDRKPKWAIPKGLRLVFQPIAWDIAADGESGHDEPYSAIAAAAASEQSSLADGTAYASYTGVAMWGTEAADKFEWSALWYFVGHGGPGYVDTKGALTPDVVTLFGQWQQPHPSPPHDRVCVHDLSSCLLVVFDSCGSGMTGPEYGLLPHIAVERGADCAVGFNGTVYVSSDWTRTFWHALAQEYEGSLPVTVAQALQRAELAFPDSHPDTEVRGDASLAIRPARYGGAAP